MQKRTKFRIGAAIVIPLTLLAALWQVSAPTRVKRAVQQQVEQQVTQKLNGVVDFNGYS